LAKPPGSLGRLEDLAIRIGLIQNRLQASADRALLLVLAGDHGLTEEGVSAYPAGVTIAMVETFLAGRASANALARTVNAELRVVDAGMAQDVPDRPQLIKRNVRRGTRNAAREPALTPDEVAAALSRGIALSETAAAEGFDILAFGEMGIGNSASAALIMHCLTAIPLDQCVGRGAGHDDAGLARKRDILARAHARAPVTAPLDVLTQFGGCEIAMMAGAVLGAAARRRIVLVDGFISTAAALAAVRIDPAAQAYCIFTHRSAEAGHRLMLEALKAEALLDLAMRLGEGTGALLAVPMVRAASQLLTEVATLEEVLKGAS
jgi:nicotinate-nucleotide--dimethylbenzimidazole phosphoribosyltransferase